MKIAIGSDHAGFHLKNRLRDMLLAEGFQVKDFGSKSLESTDYPDYAKSVGEAVTSGAAERGILICATGIGISIAANKVDGVRAAAVSESVGARLSRSHNDANIVCIGERIVGPEVAEEIARVFLTTPFSKGERHQRRIDKIKLMETNPPAP